MPPENSGASKSESRDKLNLTTAAYCGEYLPNIVGEVTRSIFENGISVPAQAKRTLRVAGHPEIRMIEKIVGVSSECNPSAFGQSEALL